MAVLDIRQRAGYLLLAVVLGHIILISAQVQSKSGAPALEAAAFGVFAEVQRVGSGMVSGVRNTWNRYVWLRGVQGDNEALRRQLADAEVQLQEQRALASRTRGLEQLLDLRDRSSLSTAAAQIIAASTTADFRTVTIDKGTSSGLKADMAVIAAGGVVGRIVVPSLRAAKVQLLVDRNAAAGALDERSRAQGIVVGGGDERLRMEYVPETAEVAQGDRIVTSGIDGIFPRGFVIGVVETVEKNGGAYRRIVIRPAVEFSSLEEVLVVLTPTPASEASGEHAP